MPVFEDKHSVGPCVTSHFTPEVETYSVPCSTQLRRGVFVAEIVVDGAGAAGQTIYHLIVQRMGSPEVLCLGQEATFQGALEQAQRSLERLVQERRKTRQRAAIYKFSVLSRSGESYCAALSSTRTFQRSSAPVITA